MQDVRRDLDRSKAKGSFILKSNSFVLVELHCITNKIINVPKVGIPGIGVVALPCSSSVVTGKLQSYKAKCCPFFYGPQGDFDPAVFGQVRRGFAAIAVVIVIVIAAFVLLLLLLMMMSTVGVQASQMGKFKKCGARN